MAIEVWAQSTHDKVRGRKGNSPAIELRIQIVKKCDIACCFTDPRAVGLEAAI